MNRLTRQTQLAGDIWKTDRLALSGYKFEHVQRFFQRRAVFLIFLISCQWLYMITGNGLILGAPRQSFCIFLLPEYYKAQKSIALSSFS